MIEGFSLHHSNRRFQNYQKSSILKQIKLTEACMELLGLTIFSSVVVV